MTKFDDFLVLIECKTSCATIAPSVVSLPGTNPPCSRETSFGISYCNLKYIAFVMILYIVLQGEIGLKSEKDLGILILGIITIFVLLKYFIIPLFFLASSITLRTSHLIKSQSTW
jgi:hypothetical protein